MRIFGRNIHIHYLLLVIVLLEFFEIEEFNIGASHHVWDGFSLMAYAYALHRLRCSKSILRWFIVLSGTAWTLDLIAFRWHFMDVEGVFWLLSHAITVYALIRSLFATQTITEAEIAGAISLFLLIGFVFANLYSLILFKNPGALVSSLSPTIRYDQVVYYSFMTQTTVGYGDFVPRHRLMRMCSVLQAITGVMYVAIFISWFVSTHSANHLNNRLNKE